MKLLKLVFGTCLLLGAQLTWSLTAAAAPSAILIAQVATNGEAATHEFVSIYNNSEADVDVTGWCMTYNGSSSKPGCIVAPDQTTKMILAARTHTTFASSAFVSVHEGFVPQARPPFSPGLADGGGTLALVNQGGAIVDSFTWTGKLTAGTVYQRGIGASGSMLDTDVDELDFSAVPFSLPEILGLYEYTPPIDICPNLPDVQTDVPEGYFLSEEGTCEQIPTDLENATINITELLPNPSSYDTGREFVELYNPNGRDVDLSSYRLELGPGYTKSYVFSGLILQANQYVSLSDTELGFSLPNTAGSVRLISPVGDIVSQTEEYSSVPEAKSWSKFGQTWQFTDVVTPGKPNVPPSEPSAKGAVSGSSFAPCPAGKYRNPDTNRCRNIATTTSSLKPCGVGEYRNPSTNRCRKLSALSGSSLTPCKPGQVRNPDTNRCRNAASVAGASLKPCDDGYERNPSTNRCRKVAQSPAALPSDPEATRDANNTLMMIVLGLTAAYGVYEYRYDMANLYNKLRMKRTKRLASRSTEKAVS